MKGIPLWPVGKGLGVCSKGVLKQPQSYVTLYLLWGLHRVKADHHFFLIGFD